MQTKEQPKFEHDCTRCQFLGHYDGADLYFCDGEPTIIARFSSEGHNYRSGLIFGYRHDLKERPGDHLRVAYLLAKDAGLLESIDVAMY
jgi:hypothetical protein